MDQGKHGSRVRFGGVRDAAQEGLPAGALPVRLPHHRDHQPEGEQGEGPPHPHPHRGRRGASGPSRRGGRFAGAPRRRAGRSGRAGHGIEGALAPHRANRRRAGRHPSAGRQPGGARRRRLGLRRIQAGPHQSGDRDLVRLLHLPDRQPPGRRSAAPGPGPAGRGVRAPERQEEAARQAEGARSTSSGSPTANPWPRRPRR